MTALDWFKSSYSSNEGPDCVEVAIAIPDATIHVRDSKNTHGSQLAFTHTAWTEFVGHARRSA
ncbi:DUF397 domain-containing protein [Streptomyces umbrinus]|uniref:DUF397 domain-containing protein n=1 Tax=Streptomyces umbrinus TaxID=67370 RepID=UPI003C2E9FA3